MVTIWFTHVISPYFYQESRQKNILTFCIECETDTKNTHTSQCKEENACLQV